MRLSHAALASLALASATLSGGGCAKGKVTRVYVRTDAPTSSPRLFHTVRVEVRRNGAVCTECTREFAFDAKAFPGGVGSFEIVGEGTADVRVRLFRDRGGLPARAAATIDVSASLSLDGQSYAVDAPMAQIARPSVGTATRTEGQASSLLPSLPPYVATCAGAPREGQVCIPGGRFWMGDPGLDLRGLGDDVDGTLERLVTLDAFYMDQTEVTVGALRRSGLAIGSDVVPAGTEACTYPSDPQDAHADTLPVNCITHRLARNYCMSVGGTLPTEAEFEYVAGGLRASSFVWGDDALRCGDAVVYIAACPPAGPRPVATTKRDTFEVTPGQMLFDIVGNVHEYTADFWSPETGPCWGTGHVKNPQCTTPDRKLPEARSLRGGAFLDLVTYAPAALRAYRDHAETRVGTSAGFRCVRR